MQTQLYTIETSFNATHSMGDGKPRHAHTFIVKIILRKKGDDIRPFSDYEKAIDNELEKYRGKYLNDLDGFREMVPSLENICLVLYEEMKDFFSKEDYYEVLRLESGDNPTRQISVGEEIYISAVNRFYGD